MVGWYPSSNRAINERRASNHCPRHDGVDLSLARGRELVVRGPGGDGRPDDVLHAKFDIQESLSPYVTRKPEPDPRPNRRTLLCYDGIKMREGIW